MKRFGRELDFISQIKRDGSGVIVPSKKYISFMKNDEFKLRRLDNDRRTWIASGFNSFVVKLKN